MPRPPSPSHSGSGFARRRELAQREVERLLAAMPAPLREKAEGVQVSCVRAPSEDILGEGFDPDLLGLFNGSEYAGAPHDAGGYEMPPVMHLFLDNLWDYAGGDLAVFREEVRRTYLHELGHYLGLDEDDLAARDLD